MMGTTVLKTSMQWVIYPLLMLSGLSGYVVLQSNFPGVIWFAYLPVLAATIFVTGLEYFIPQNRNWFPDRDDIKTDLAYMLFVQISVPLLIGIGLVSFLSTPLANMGENISGVWPHHWPLLVQGLLLLLVAEFFSYWLHRLAHSVPVLWRLHAVHHSAEKLYWLNVGRFHPLEKVLQYLVSTFPFMVLGVSPDVLGLYFVFYGINGFFQHSNIKLKYGLLNYIVSSASLHRWHHSPDVYESSHNYGNNLIVWDLIFGTWYLPKDRKITTVGSGIEKYPQSFMQQLARPFKQDKTSQPFSFRFIYRKIKMKMLATYLTCFYWKPFIQKAGDPVLQQKKILMKILHNNSRTRFGRIHNFREITAENKFKISVPISQYEDIEAMIKEQETTGRSILHKDKALFYARTSGTTGRPKDIPITPGALAQFKLQQRLLASYQYQICPEAFMGKALGIVSPAVEGQLEGGSLFGSVSGYIYKTMPKFLRTRYVIPAEIFEISDYDLKYRVITRLALAETNITYLGTANPSTFLRIRQLLTDEWDELLDSLKTGELKGIELLPEDLQILLNKIIKPEPDRYEQLKKLRYSEYREYKHIWPSIKLVTTWTGGNCQVALDQLINSFPEETKIIELGYIASELRCTLTCEPITNSGIPMLDQVYYEFIEKDDWDNGQRETLNITQLQQGKRYYIIVTTDYGLYRYFMNDLVVVSGTYLSTPLLKFVQKGRGVTNITGEKVYETQINEAILTQCRNNELEVRFHLSLANVVNARYEIYLEINKPGQVNIYALSHAIDKYLTGMNTEYSDKRNSGRLRAPRVYLLGNNISEVYKRFQIERGQREGQYKIISLIEKDDCDFPVHEYLIDQDEMERYA